MKFSSSGILRGLTACAVLTAAGCSQMSNRLWSSAPARVQTPFQMARNHEAQGDPHGLQIAEQTYRRLYQKDPHNVAALHRLAIVTARQNRVDESLEHFQKALAMTPHNPQLKADYGYALFLHGDLKEAESALASAVDRDASNRRAINNLALVYGAQGLREKCLATYRRTHSKSEALVACERAMAAAAKPQDSPPSKTELASANRNTKQAERVNRASIDFEFEPFPADQAKQDASTRPTPKSAKKTSVRSGRSRTDVSSTGSGVKSNDVFPSGAKVDRAAAKPNSGFPSVRQARSIPAKASRHFSTGAGDTSPTLAGATRAKTKQSSGVSGWSSGNKIANRGTEKSQAGTDAGTIEAKPFPSLAESHTPKSTPQGRTVSSKTSASPPRPVGKRLTVHATKTAEAGGQPASRTVTQTGFESDLTGLNLGAEWNKKSAERERLRRAFKMAKRPTKRPAAAKSSKPSTGKTAAGTKTVQPKPAATPKATESKKSDPRRFANFVDWSHAEKESAAQRKKQQAKKAAATPQPPRRSTQPQPTPAKRNAKPATRLPASGWAPRRQSQPNRVTAADRSGKVVVAAEPRAAASRVRIDAEPAAKPTRPGADRGRVRLAPATVVSEQPIRFKMRSDAERPAAVGRVKLSPNAATRQPAVESEQRTGRVRL